MRVFARHGVDEINLGYMPVLPEVGDRVNFEAPGIVAGSDPYEAFMIVGRRTFERRGALSSTLLSDMEPVVTVVTAWVCVLAPQESR